MAWFCDCDDGTAPMKKEPPKQKPLQSKEGLQGAAGRVSADQMRMPPSEGELVPEFSGPRPVMAGSPPDHFLLPFDSASLCRGLFTLQRQQTSNEACRPAIFAANMPSLHA